MDATTDRGVVQMAFDVIIAGASFGGLAVASRLRAGQRVLLLDRQPIGEGQTSACAAPLVTLDRMGARDAVLQVHDGLVIHTPRGTAVWRSGVPFATFDYQVFCRTIVERLDVEVKVAAVHDLRDGAMLTDIGEFSAPLIVDATGWRAVLAGRMRRGYVRRRLMGFGLETELPVTVPPGLHFYFDRRIVRHGYAWAFPAGAQTRFGVASAAAETKLRGALERFLAGFDLRPDVYHGGFLASGLRDPVVGGVFVVGDAAGQCLPLTGEGIRMAVRAGQFLGAHLQMILDGTLSIEAVQERYRAFARAQRRDYAALLVFQAGFLHLAPWLLGPASQIMTHPRPLRRFFDWYMDIFALPGFPRGPAAGQRQLVDANAV